MRSRIESARAPLPSQSGQLSAVNWAQKIVDVWPTEYFGWKNQPIRRFVSPSPDSGFKRFGMVPIGYLRIFSIDSVDFQHGAIMLLINILNFDAVWIVNNPINNSIVHSCFRKFGVPAEWAELGAENRGKFFMTGVDNLQYVPGFRFGQFDQWIFRLKKPVCPVVRSTETGQGFQAFRYRANWLFKVF